MEPMPQVCPPQGSEQETIVKELRVARGLSKEALAAAAGLSLRTIYNAELPGWRPQRATRAVLALALGVDPDELVPHDERRPSEAGAVKEPRRQARHDAG